MATRKVNVTLTLLIDTEVWSDTYGVPKAAVPSDVREYVLTHVQDAAAGESGAMKSVAVKS